MPAASAVPTEMSWAQSARPSASSSPRQTPYETPASTAAAITMRTVASAVRAKSIRPQPTAQKKQQQGRAGDVHERGRERDPPGSEAVERPVKRRVQRQVGDRDHGREPGRLQAEEGPVQHQHRAVEGQPEREGGQGGRNHRRLPRAELAALIDEPDDRLREHGHEGARRHEQEGDLPQAEPDRSNESRRDRHVRPDATAREEHGRDGDREHPCGSM